MKGKYFNALEKADIYIAPATSLHPIHNAWGCQMVSNFHEGKKPTL